MRVLVLRPQHDAEQTAKLIEMRGHKAVIAPLLDIRPLDIGIIEPALYTAIIATSANAFRCLPDTLDDKIKTMPCFTVGSHTSEAGYIYGFNTIINASGDTTALLKMVTGTVPVNSRLLYITGQPRKPEVETSLMQYGYNVTICETYNTEAVKRLPQNAIAAFEQGLDVILHFSRHSAEIAMTLFEQSGLMQKAQQVRHICISNDAASVLHKCPHVQIAKTPDQSAMLNLVES